MTALLTDLQIVLVILATWHAAVSSQYQPFCGTDSTCCLESPEGWIKIDYSDYCYDCGCTPDDYVRTCTCCPTGYFKCLETNDFGGDYCCKIGTSCAGVGICANVTLTYSRSPNFIPCPANNYVYTNPTTQTTVAQSGSSVPSGQPNFTITVDNFLLELYFDGVQVPASQIPFSSDNQWRIPDVVPLPSNVRLIALKAKNEDISGNAGVMASDSFGTILSGSKWKCTASVSPSDPWMMPSYSDASWPPAVANGANSPGTFPWSNIPSINPAAQWMWTTSMPTQQQNVYCRFTRDSNLTITVDNYLRALYIDGVQVPSSLLPNGNNIQWRIPDVIALPKNPTLIALQAENAEEDFYAGILASDTFGNILTNASWKCVSSVSSDQWMTPSYADSDWSLAVVNAANFPGTYRWANIPSINPAAQWIWTTIQPTTEKTVFCRLKLI